MSSAKTTKESASATRKHLENIKKRLGRHYQKVNTSQPALLLKAKQTRKVSAEVQREKTLAAEKKRKENMRKAYEKFLQGRILTNYNSNSNSNSSSNSSSNSNSNNNSPSSIIASIRATMKKNTKERKTRKSRR